MTKHYDQTKRHRGSSPPDQEMGRESDEVLNERFKGLKASPPTSKPIQIDSIENRSNGEDMGRLKE